MQIVVKYITSIKHETVCLQCSVKLNKNVYNSCLLKFYLALKTKELLFRCLTPAHNSCILCLYFKQWLISSVAVWSHILQYQSLSCVRVDFHRFPLAGAATLWPVNLSFALLRHITVYLFLVLFISLAQLILPCSDRSLFHCSFDFLRVFCFSLCRGWQTSWYCGDVALTLESCNVIKGVTPFLSRFFSIFVKIAWQVIYFGYLESKFLGVIYGEAKHHSSNCKLYLTSSSLFLRYSSVRQ